MHGVALVPAMDRVQVSRCIRQRRNSYRQRCGALGSGLGETTETRELGGQTAAVYEQKKT